MLRKLSWSLRASLEGENEVVLGEDHVNWFADADAALREFVNNLAADAIDDIDGEDVVGDGADSHEIGVEILEDDVFTNE